MRRVLVLILGFCSLCAASLAGTGDVQRAPNDTGPSSAGAFNAWLFGSTGEHGGAMALRYAEFQDFLSGEGVARGRTIRLALRDRVFRDAAERPVE